MQAIEQVSDQTDNVTLSGKVGIVLLNMGGPETLDDVRPFLYNLFADPDIINLPWFLRPFQRQLAWLIAKFRTPGTTKMYEQIGNSSPILPITRDLGEKIAQYLDHRDLSVIPVVAMRYTYPRAADAIKHLQEQDVDQIILFSQYPHYADSTTGSSLRDFYDQMDGLNYRPQAIMEISEWGEEPEYINWWADGIRMAIRENDIDLNESVHLIFSAHGLPKRYIDAGEIYDQRIKQSASKVMSEIPDIIDKIVTHISFQSQAGPIEWTKPYTDELLQEIAEMKDQTVIIVPLGFVSNHVETLYEIDILYKQDVEGNGITGYYRIEVPDSDDDYAKSISEFIRRRVEEQ